jgi:hypothetical protein
MFISSRLRVRNINQDDDHTDTTHRVTDTKSSPTRVNTRYTPTSETTTMTCFDTSNTNTNLIDDERKGGSRCRRVSGLGKFFFLIFLLLLYWILLLLLASYMYRTTTNGHQYQHKAATSQRHETVVWALRRWEYDVRCKEAEAWSRSSIIIDRYSLTRIQLCTSLLVLIIIVLYHFSFGELALNIALIRIQIVTTIH